MKKRRKQGREIKKQTIEVIGLHATEVQKKRKKKERPIPSTTTTEKEKEKKTQNNKIKTTNKQKEKRKFSPLCFITDYYRIIVNEYDYECRVVHDYEHHA